MTTPGFLDGRAAASPTSSGRDGVSAARSGSGVAEQFGSGSRWAGRPAFPRSEPRRGGLARGGGPRAHRPYRWRVLVWRLRFPFATVLLGCAAALAVAQLRPAPPPQVAVVVAARDLSPGTPLTADDVRVAHVPPELVVDGAHTSPDSVLGRAVVVTVPAGLSVVDALLRDDRLASAGPPGTVVVPVRLADPGVAALLRPGDVVDLFAAATSATGAIVAERLAQRAVVLPNPAPDDASGDSRPGLLGVVPGGDGGASLTLVAVSPDQASALAGALGWAGISAVLVE